MSHATAPLRPLIVRGSGTKTVAIVQSNYIPWRGYFDLINLVDEFILLDDVQYTRRDWRNRNRIKTPAGVQWLTIPVASKGRYLQTIRETTINDPTWPRQHWQFIQHNLARAPYFSTYRPLLEDLYSTMTEPFLSLVNYRFLRAICDLLGIRTPIRWSTDYQTQGHKTERLLDLCQQAGATAYLSGPAARAYIEEEQFRQAQITLHYMDYAGYPEYPQLFPPFDHHVSIIDLLCNVGPDAPRYLKSFGP
jgi:hypothetical protein